MYDVGTSFGLCIKLQLTAFGNYVLLMSDARKTAMCSFPGIARISVGFQDYISAQHTKIQSANRTYMYVYDIIHYNKFCVIFFLNNQNVAQLANSA